MDDGGSREHRSLRNWKKIRVLIYSIRAFSLKVDNDAENQNLLLDTLLQPTSEAVLHVYPDCLSDLAHLRNIEKLRQLGGISGVASSVGTDAEKGIQGEEADINGRHREYGSNRIDKRPPLKLQVLLAPAKDPILVVLLLCGTLALCFGVKHHGKDGLSDGVSIFVAIILFITIRASTDLWPKLQLFKLSKARDEFNTLVLRNGRHQIITVFEVVVGDVVVLKTGDQVPADGLYIDGNSLEVDESNLRACMVSVAVNESDNPFLLSGTKVTNGDARMLVTAVGMNTEWGKFLTLESCHSDWSTTPLQKKLHTLSKLIGKTGLAVASVVLVVLLVRYFIGNLHDDSGKPHFLVGKTRVSEVFYDVIGILATLVAIASTFPEGLVLAVLLSMAFSTKKMTTQKAQVRNLSACEAIGTTTVICTDERCKLTSNHLAVTGFCFSDKHIVEYPSSAIPPKVLELLFQAVFLSHSNTSSVSPSSSPDSQIENAIQEWGARDLSFDLEQVRASYTIHTPDSTLNSEMTESWTWIKKKTDNSLHVHQTGEAKAILDKCSHYYDENGDIKYITTSFRENLAKKISQMYSNGLRCVAFAHKNMSEDSDEEDGKSGGEDGNPVPKFEKECVVFIGFLGLKDSCLAEVRKAVEDCKMAGVDIKIVTRTDVLTARAIAVECGILEANCEMNREEVVDAQEFRTYTDDEKLEKCQAIRVMARANTLDKLCMVKCLKEKGEVVAVTGDTAGDANVLREADVGVSLGTKGTQQVKVNSDVIINEDNFDSLVKILTWGRAMCHKIQLSAQFQLTVIISSLVVDSVTAVCAREPPNFKIVTAISSGKVPYAALQVLWVKLVVGILAAVAISVEEPGELWQLPKIKLDQSFITRTMWKRIVGHAVYPVIALLTIHFQGIFNLDPGVKDTMIFNTFVLWQVCVMLIIGNESGSIWRRKLFCSIVGFIIVVEAVMVEVLHKFADTKRLTWKEWMVCIGIAALAWPIGWLIERMKFMRISK